MGYPVTAAQMYGGEISAVRYYEERLLTAPAPDHPIAIEAYQKLIRREANAIGWASRD